MKAMRAYVSELSVWNPCQTMATCKRNISQHCWPNICKLRPNDCSISVLYIATLLGATGYVRLTTLLWPVATCCVLKIEQVRMPRCNGTRTSCNIHKGCMTTLTILKFQPTTSSIAQHLATCRDRVAKRAQHVAPNDVATVWLGLAATP